MDDKQPFEYVNRDSLDPEVIGLVLALNSIDGIHTFESCCGHGHTLFWIVFQADSFESLAHALWWFRKSQELHDYRKWIVTVNTDVDKSQVYYTLKGPSGEQAYREANTLATMILERSSGASRFFQPLWAQLRGGKE